MKAEPDALAFSGIKGGPLRRSGFNRLASWREAVRVVGAECPHVHDLRHTGNMIAAESGAGLKDLMARMGHDNVRAAMIYQHVVRGPTKRSQMLSTSTSAVRMTRVRTGRPGCSRPWADYTLIARKIEKASETVKARVGNHALACALGGSE
ncbi:tyrosine-type recombinase/integrase [Sphaerisporangium sp. NPDC005289]|uniref:tyrosine-type recombinase/integrase n=1 Tax=Sphaerisporangium sp. NPDC005289 TaxID=3155247 RepID=UPI0033BCF6F5